jgi:transcriptional regulator with XRE-family HTH domain
MKKKSFKDLFDKAGQRDTFQTAKIILDFTEGLYGLMQENKISRVELAKRLGSSPAYITKVLRGDINFTVETMVRLAKAVGGSVHVHMGPREITRWVGVVDGKKDGLPKWKETSETQVVFYSNKKGQGDGTIPAAA